MARDRGGRSHSGADQMRAAAFALSAFEVAVAGARTTLAGREYIGVHA